MALTIDNLEIQISSNASKAHKGIDALATSLESLGSAVGGAKGVASELSELAGALKSLANVGKISLTSTANALKTLEGLNLAGVPKQLEDLSKGFVYLDSIQKGNLGSVVNQLKKIPDITKSLDDATIEQFSVAIRKLVDALAPLATQMDAVARGFSSLPSHMQRAIKASNNVATANRRTTKSYNSLFTTLSRGAARFWTLYYTMRRVADVFAACYNESNEYIESLNLFTVSMGDATDAAKGYAETLGDLMGIDPAEWMQNQGVFMRMSTGFGVTAEQAEIMSQNLTQLGYDMASFFNADVETAMQKLQSGMSGQIKGLKAWGFNLSVAALQETALSLGIDQSVRSMTEAQKAQLRYITLMQKSNGIMNDMARTINTPANSMRVLSAQMTQLKRAFGDIVSILATRVIPYVQAFVELMTEAAKELADFFGFELPSIDYSNLDLAADIMDDVDDNIADTEENVSKLKKQLMGFDELNILKNPDDDKGAGDLANYDLGIDLPEYDFLDGLSREYRDKIDEIKKEMKELVDKLAPVANTLAAIFAFGWVAGAIEKFKKLKIVSTITDSIRGALLGAHTVFEGTGSYLKALGAGFSTLWSQFRNFMTGLSPIVKGLVTIIGLYAEFKVVKGAVKDVIDGNITLGQSLKRIIPITAAVGTAMYAMLGPWGLILTAVAGIAAGIDAWHDSQVEFHYELAKTQYYENNGIAIDKVRTALTNYFNSMDFDKQAEWISKIENAQGAYDDAREAYDNMWWSIADKPVFDASDIEGLTEAFNDLAEAAKAVNDAKIGSLMESIRLGIELNITDALSDRLGGLLDKIKEAKAILGTEIDGLSAEYQAILTEISQSGGVATSEQKDRLAQLREDITKFTLSDDTSSERWKIEIEDALNSVIDAGDDADSVLASVNDLMGDAEVYLNSLKDKYATDVNTLTQLIELDKNEFGGALGFSNADLSTLKETYEAQIAEVRTMYNAILDQIIASYEKNTVAASGKEYEKIRDSEFWDALAMFGTSLIGVFDPEYEANSILAREQKELLEELKKKYIKGYASGGFPSMGEMFIARESGPELVGRIGNKNAVANNDQITAGIASAVYSAMMAAHEDNEGDGSSGRIIVQIGDEVVGEAAVRFINGRIVQTGESPIYA